MRKDGDAKPTRSQQAYALLREQIVTLAHPPGATLGENKVMQLLGIGPGPARYALQRLASERLLNVVPRGQSVVVPIILSEVAQSFQIRTSLETLTARILAKTPDPGRIAEMQQIVETMRAALGEGELRRVVDGHRALFKALVASTNNGKLIETLGFVNPPTERFAYLVAQRFNRTMDEPAVYDDLLDAIARGDGEAAATVIRGPVGKQRGTTIMDFLHYDLF